jgi:hypothetical protein
LFILPEKKKKKFFPGSAFIIIIIFIIIIVIIFLNKYTLPARWRRVYAYPTRLPPARLSNSDLSIENISCAQSRRVG